MKRPYLTLLISFLFSTAYSQNIGIGTITPDKSAALEIKDNSRGILIPRMTMTEKNNIQKPAEGLMVYQTDERKGLWYFDGSSWIIYLTSNNSQISQTSRRLQTQIYLKN